MNVLFRASSVALLAALSSLSACSAARSAAEPPFPMRSQAAHAQVDKLADFSGTWQTTYGLMQLGLEGQRLRGTYGPDGTGSTIEGSLHESRFQFRYDESGVRGEGWFELSADRSKLSGEWRADGESEWQAWSGERASAAAITNSFEGAWKSTYGTLRLRLEGDRAHGFYTYAGRSAIEGVVEGDVLRATYTEPDGTRGAALFELADDGRSFRGVWAPDPSAQLALDAVGASEWSGERIEPVPGRVWLVILEAHWEGSLADPEYSYGAMLRSFFTRLPHVEVRQRFFHDKADFTRFCAELSGLVEPVVLYVSSHGAKEGIQTRDGLLDGATIGAALRDAGELKLLHFGACEVLGGELPQIVRESAAPHEPFPISGFPVAVDWAGSALVDFTYLELILGRGFSPADAVRETCSMLSFARGPDKAQGPIPGTGLMLLDWNKRP